jgi:hypothetical protein
VRFFFDGTRLATSDNYDMFNVASDRYDWKLIGKKKLYIPYNSYKLDSPQQGLWVTAKSVIDVNHSGGEPARENFRGAAFSQIARFILDVHCRNTPRSVLAPTGTRNTCATAPG